MQQKKNHSKGKLSFYGLLLILALLPWQMGYIFFAPSYKGQVLEFEKGVVFGVEVLVMLLFLWVMMERRLFLRYRRAALIGIIAGGVIVLGTQTFLGYIWIMHTLMAGILAYLLWLHKKDALRQMQAFILGVSVSSMVGVYQVIRGTSPASTWLGLAAHSAERLGEAVVYMGDHRVLRAYGFFAHPNIFGGYAVIGVLLCWMSLEHTRKHRLYFYVGMVLCVVGLLLSFSRSACLLFVLGCVLVAFRNRHAGRLYLKRMRIPLIILVVVGVCLGGGTYGAWRQRTLATSAIEQRSIYERTSQYREALMLFREHPLVGVGLGRYTSMLRAMTPFQPAFAYQPVHNVFVLALVEVGVLGSIFVCALVGYLYFRIRKGGHVLHVVWILTPLLVLDHYVWTSVSGRFLVVVWVCLGGYRGSLDSVGAIPNNEDSISTLNE